MKNPQQPSRLMKYSPEERTFILNAMARIEVDIEEHLYNYEGAIEKMWYT